MNNVTLSSGMRTNLLSLQNTNKLLGRTQERLSTGLKINSALDGPSAYFAANSLRDTASELDTRLDGMGAAIQTMKSAEQGLDTIRSLLEQAKAVASDASDETVDGDRRSLGVQFNEIIRQINSVASDTSYLGTNLIQRPDPTDQSGQDDEMIIQFGEKINSSTLVIQGFNISGPSAALDSSGEAEGPLALSSATTAFASLHVQTHGVSGDSWEKDWGATDYRTSLRDVISQIELFDNELQIRSQSLANHLNIVTLRENFTEKMINSYEVGADNLTVADLNEEGANLLALQTSQQLGVSSLSLASQARQSVLRLLG